MAAALEVLAPLPRGWPLLQDEGCLPQGELLLSPMASLHCSNFCGDRGLVSVSAGCFVCADIADCYLSRVNFLPDIVIANVHMLCLSDAVLGFWLDWLLLCYLSR